MNAIIDRLQFQLGAEILPDSRWGLFLDEVRAYTQTVEQALRSLRENRDKLLAIIDLLPNLPSFIRRVCSGYALVWGVLRTQSV
jgi:hypothetical protein